MDDRETCYVLSAVRVIPLVVGSKAKHGLSQSSCRFGRSMGRRAAQGWDYLLVLGNLFEAGLLIRIAE